MEVSRSLSVIIPAYNEESIIKQTVERTLKYLERNKFDYEIIVVDDKSGDKTKEVINSLSSVSKNIKLIEHKINKGKFSAIKSGISCAIKPLVMFQDADGSTPIEEIERLLKSIDEGSDIAIASRKLKEQGTVVETSFKRKFIGYIFGKIVNIIVLPGIKDTQCGFKLFKREVAKQVFSLAHDSRWAFDVELLYIARLKNYKISEVAVNWHNEEGSKVDLFIDPIKMFIDIFKFRYYGLTNSYDKPKLKNQDESL